MNRTEGSSAGTATSNNDAGAAVAVQRANGVWVMPAARIKQILRGTFLENPSQSGS